MSRRPEAQDPGEGDAGGGAGAGATPRPEAPAGAASGPASLPGRDGDVRGVLEQRAVALERELFEVRDELRRLGSDVLPGQFVEAELPGLRFLVPVAAVREVAWLVELEPVGGAPPWLAGTFSYRGETCAAIDLARRLGTEREPPREARLLVLAATRPVAAIVDRVLGLVERPRILRGEGARPPFAGLCERGTELLPLLDPEALAEPDPPAAP